MYPITYLSAVRCLVSCAERKGKPADLYGASLLLLAPDYQNIGHTVESTVENFIAGKICCKPSKIDNTWITILMSCFLAKIVMLDLL